MRIFSIASVACVVGTSFVFAAQNEIDQTISGKVLRDEESMSCTMVQDIQLTQLHRGIQAPEDILELRTLNQNKASMQEMNFRGTQYFIEVYGASIDSVAKAIEERCPNGVITPNEAHISSDKREKPIINGDKIVIKKLVDSGDPKNRIDVVLMGDGYTTNDETKFFEDMQRLTHDMFTGDTFAQYLPLFNIWGVFVPSKDQGIGVGGRSKNTPFGLYRDGTELRGIYCSNPSAARKVCQKVGQYACDFPSLIGNDDFYGGLGGEFTISTRSPTSATIVLRHEMGHNFGQVGEEYDGGQVYSGANSISSLSSITWKHWLTNPNQIREEKMAVTFTDHMWYDLKKGPYKIPFKTDGSYKRWMLSLSASGVDTNDSLNIILDGKPLEWKTNGVKDRTFYTWNSTEGLSAGKHEIIVKSGDNNFDGPIMKQLCHLDLMEYGDENEFQMNNEEVISAYPTWNSFGRKKYRPTNEKCLMRNMLSTKFCNVCYENMWLKFMERLEFIDEVVVIGSKVNLKLIPLGQLRSPIINTRTEQESIQEQEKYTVNWSKNDQEEIQFKDQFQVDLAKSTLGTKGEWKVLVKLETPSVRYDPKKYMQSVKTFTVQ
jgi:hypothetical protein